MPTDSTCFLLATPRPRASPILTAGPAVTGTVKFSLAVTLLQGLIISQMMIPSLSLILRLHLKHRTMILRLMILRLMILRLMILHLMILHLLLARHKDKQRPRIHRALSTVALIPMHQAPLDTQRRARALSRQHPLRRNRKLLRRHHRTLILIIPIPMPTPTATHRLRDPSALGSMSRSITLLPITPRQTAQRLSILLRSCWMVNW